MLTLTAAAWFAPEYLAGFKKADVCPADINKNRETFKDFIVLMFPT
jgi:hypothetical protein